MDDISVDQTNLIGEGGFGKVYASDCKKYAFKVYNKEGQDYKDDKEFLAMCQNHPKMISMDLHYQLL